jgi:hypothetical protein
MAASLGFPNITPDFSRRFTGSTNLLGPEVFGQGFQMPTGMEQPTYIPLAGNGFFADFNAFMKANPEFAKGGPFDNVLAYRLIRESDPERQRQARKEILDDQLAYAKQLGDQMMKYRMQNDIIANLGSAARSAFSRYTDPGAIANRIGGIGTAYAQGLQASQALTNLGSGQPEIQYYRA